MRKNWRNVVAAAICSAVMMTFTGCPADGEDEILKNAEISLSNKNDAKQSAFADDASTGQGFTFTAKDDWVASVKDTGSKGGGNATWVKLTHNGTETYSGSAGTYTLTITIETNLTGERREATIEIVCGTDKITVTVTQEGTTKGGEKPAANPVELTNAMINESNKTLAAGVYLVKSSVTLSAPNRLTISAGTVIKFAGNQSFIINDNATLIAVGTASSPIVFTSEKDNPQPGEWDMLRINKCDGSVLEHCIIEYGGRLSNWGMLNVACKMKINNCTLRDSKYIGLWLWGSQGFEEFNNNKITNCANSDIPEHPIRADHIYELQNFGTGNVISNSVPYKGILVKGSTLDRSLTLKNIGVPYFMESQTIDSSPSIAALTIEKGTEIRMLTGCGIDARNGTIDARGTENEPIRFTSYRVGAQPGDWGSIIIRHDGSVFEHCIFEYGATASNWAMVNTASKIKMNNCTLKDSKYIALWLWDSQGFEEFNNNKFINCANTDVPEHPMRADHLYEMQNFGTGNTFSNTVPNKGVLIKSSTLNRNVTLKKINAPYFFEGTTTITSSSGATLTIEPGTQIKMLVQARFDITENGKIIARGTANDRISITGLLDQRGYWDYILFHNANVQEGNILEYCDIINGGRYTSSWEGAIYLWNTRAEQVTIRNCHIAKTLGYGIYLYTNTTNATMSGNTFADCGLGNIYRP